MLITANRIGGKKGTQFYIEPRFGVQYYIGYLTTGFTRRDEYFALRALLYEITLGILNEIYQKQKYNYIL